VSKIISSKNIKDYKIEKFSFNSHSDSKKADVSSFFSPEHKEEEKKPQEEKQSSNCEELLLKVEELTSEIVSLQMDMEEQKKDFEKKLIKVKEESYKEGIQEATTNLQNEIEDLKVQYISSITNLQELEFEIKEKLSQFEEELIETSIIISSKVINKEVEENSSHIAKSIAKYLLNDIKDELEIKLLVNPVDYDEIIKENLKDGLKVISDKSIKRGGVVLLSKEKNLDGTIETRFKKTLQLIKES